MSLVLGLGLEHSCPWPRECLSSERLSLALALASDFFCVLGLGLEPCVLDSTFGIESFREYVKACQGLVHTDKDGSTVRYVQNLRSLLRTSHLEPYGTSVPYFSSIFEAYRTNVPYPYYYKKKRRTAPAYRTS